MYDYHLKIRMHSPLFHRIPKLGNKHGSLLNAPAHHFGQEEQSPALGALGNVQKVPAPQLFHVWISRPAIDRHLVHPLHNILKPLVLDVRAQVPYLVETLAKLLTRLMKHVAPLTHWVFGSQGAIVGFELDAHFQLVQIASRLQAIVDLCIQGRPVRYTAV